LLVKPPFNRVYHIDASLNRLPLSLAYLAAVIDEKKPNWDVKIYNSDFSPQDFHLSLEYLTGIGFENYRQTMDDPHAPIWREVETRIRNLKPSVIGITATSQTFASSCRIANIAKSIDENVVVIVGGPHPSVFGKDILNNNVIDFAVTREGEETIIELLNHLDGLQDISSINGIAYRNGEEIIENPERPFIDDLDSLPFPITMAKNHLVDFEKYPLQAFKYILGSRGCPFDCVFCDSRHVWSRKVRARSVASIVEEIKAIQEFGINYIDFIDDTFGLDKKFVHDFCEAIRPLRPKLKWSCETHVSCVDDDTVKMMKAAGCRRIQIGVESGNNEILKYMRKHITIEKAFAAAKIIKKHGIYLQTFFIVGFPDETEETLDETISAMKSIPCDLVIYNTFTPSIGATSPHDGEEVVKLSADFDATLYHHQSPENYFCKNIEKDVLADRLRSLERSLDTLNSRKKFKVYLS